MARLPQPGGDQGDWGNILNDYLSQSFTTTGTLKPGTVGASQLQANSVTSAALAPDSVTATTVADGTITEAQLDTAAQTKLNSSADAVLLTTDQTIDGEKTFDALTRTKTAFRAEGAAGEGHFQMSGGPYPIAGVIDSASATVASQWVVNPTTGTSYFDYRSSTGGVLGFRNSINAGTTVMELNSAGDATFANKVTTSSLQVSGSAPATGKVLTSDASGNATWQPPANSGGATTPLGSIKMKELYQPIVGVLPASEIAQDQYFHDNVDSINYTSLSGTVWNSPKLNTQSQNFVANNPQNVAAGCTNMTNGRIVGSCFDFEFELTGDKFAIHMQSFGYLDTQIYVEHEGQMMKIQSYPLADDYSGFNFRSVRFSRYATRRIRVVLPFLYFIQIVHESNAIVKRTPNRPMIAITGDSYVDASSSYNAGSSRSYVVAGTVDAIIEATGFAVLRLGQGGTGYFNNATGAASDAVGPVNSTPFFSPQRIAALSAFGPESLLALVVNGTINDGELSGGTAGMKARALAGYQAVSAFDDGVSIVAITAEPLSNPTAGSVHDLNRIGIIQAIDEHPQGIGSIDAYNPQDPLWTGTGTEANPLNDPQSKIIGNDGIHPNWAGHKFYGQYIATRMGEYKVPIERAWL